MKTLTSRDLEAMDKLARVQFATSLPGVKPVCLVGTRNAAGIGNLAPFSSVVHLGSNPALLGMMTRPDVVERHTLANILDSRLLDAQPPPSRHRRGRPPVLRPLSGGRFGIRRHRPDRAPRAGLRRARSSPSRASASASNWRS
jgi:hypothetical protein